MQGWGELTPPEPMEWDCERGHYSLSIYDSEKWTKEGIRSVLFLALNCEDFEAAS